MNGIREEKKDGRNEERKGKSVIVFVGGVKMVDCRLT